jgi:predicted DNA-binding transcriptional regulator AlpA
MGFAGWYGEEQWSNPMNRDDVDEEAPTAVFFRPTVRAPAKAPTSARDGLWDANDVAAFLKVSRSWVYHRAEAGQLPCVRVGGLLRFDPSTIRASARGEAPATKRVVAFSKKLRG